jgi:uncharacterized DUF497 family protein
MEFEWDPNKAASNLTKHKVSFREAATVFRDPLSITFDDPDHGDDKDRSITIGTSSGGRLLIVAHTDRGMRIRIISARETTSTERDLYEEGQ